MPTNGETPEDARTTLLGYLEGGQTGCITGHATAGRFQVYLMLGEVLAAHCEHDGTRTIELLRNDGVLNGEQVESLSARVAAGTSVTEALFEYVDDQVVVDLCFERFRENLFQFLAGAETAEFAAMEAVFTDNIQVGHDSRVMIEELWGLLEQVGGLAANPDVVLSVGKKRPFTPEQRKLLALCGEGTRLSTLLQRSPWEDGRTLQRVKEALDTGVILAGAAPLPQRAADHPPHSREVLPPPDPTDFDDVTEEASYRRVELTDADLAPVSEDPELAAFQDYDTSRSGGDFVGDILDRVEVTDEQPAPRLPALDAAADTIIEMEDADAAIQAGTVGAVSLNFSGPLLEDDDATRKVEVLNEVLASICAAVDAKEGPGAGRARIQILVEGTTGGISALFKNVEVDPRGHLPTSVVLKNLRKRPVAEHRRLMANGVSDLIERSLSMACENLDDDPIDRLLEAVAGYQSRLGT